MNGKLIEWVLISHCNGKIVGYYIKKWKFAQWWSTIPPSPTKQKQTSSPQQFTTYSVGNPGPDVGQEQNMEVLKWPEESKTCTPTILVTLKQIIIYNDT